MPGQRHVTFRTSEKLHAQVGEIAELDGVSRSEAIVHLLQLGLEARAGNHQTLQDSLDAVAERMEGLETLIAAVGTDVSNTTSKELADLYRRQLRFFENLVAWEVEILMLLRVSIGSRTPQVIADAQLHARDFLAKKYAQLGLAPPTPTSEGKRA